MGSYRYMRIETEKILKIIRGGLIVSCQALPGEPLFGSNIMAKMAIAAWEGGASGIRCNTPSDIEEIRKVVPLPIIGLYKDGENEVYITPTLHHARQVAQAGAHIIAIDGTQRPRPDGKRLKEIIDAIHVEMGKIALADISTFQEGLLAQEAGADMVSTTLSGYTPYSPQQIEPDIDLVAQLSRRLTIPVLAEGRIHTPEEARLALEAGATAVVVGAAITRPQLITARFVEKMKSKQH